MSELFTSLAELAWPAAIALAWVLGELAHRWCSDASYLRRRHQERGSCEGMVDAAIRVFRGHAA